jgi:hypothetical protein
VIIRRFLSGTCGAVAYIASIKKEGGYRLKIGNPGVQPIKELERFLVDWTARHQSLDKVETRRERAPWRIGKEIES